MYDEDDDDINLIFDPIAMMKTITYPQKGDKLFITNTGGPYVSCLNFQNDHLQLYISGYKDAGDALVITMKKNTSYLDTLLFPAIFLYRHYLELSLKEISRDGNILLGTPSKLNKSQATKNQIDYEFFQEGEGHNLKKLWEKCEGILKQVDQKFPELKMFEKVDLAAFGELFDEFSDVDPKSDAARYPVNTKQHPTFSNWKTVDMVHMKKIIGKMHAYFEGVSCAIAEYIQEEREMLSYYAADNDY